MGCWGCARSDGNIPGSCPLLWEGSWAEPAPVLAAGESRALAKSGPGREERVGHGPGRGSSGRRRVEAICSCRGRRTFPLPAGRVEGPADAPVPGGGSSLAQDAGAALPDPGPSLPPSLRGLHVPVPVLPRAERGGGSAGSASGGAGLQHTAAIQPGRRARPCVNSPGRALNEPFFPAAPPGQGSRMPSRPGCRLPPLRLRVALPALASLVPTRPHGSSGEPTLVPESRVWLC